jgi:hypothetical protein
MKTVTNIYTAKTIGAAVGGINSLTDLEPVRVDLSGATYKLATIEVKVTVGTTIPDPVGYLVLHYGFSNTALAAPASPSTSGSSSSSSSSSSATGPIATTVAPDQLRWSNEKLNITFASSSIAAGDIYVFRTEPFPVVADYMYCWMDTFKMGQDVAVTADVVSI